VKCTYYKKPKESYIAIGVVVLMFLAVSIETYISAKSWSTGGTGLVSVYLTAVTKPTTSFHLPLN
jgi:hypothetical protein